MSKKVLFTLIAVTLVFGLVVSSPALAKLKVGMVFDIGGKGDQSFNDSAYRGLQWASDKYGVSHDLYITRNRESIGLSTSFEH